MQWLTLGSFVFFTALVGLGTWLLTRKDRHDTSAGYFLAGRTLTGGYIAGSLLLTNLSTEQLVGLNGAAFADGLAVMAWEVIAGLSLIVMALFFLPRYLKSGIATVPQFLEERYAGSTRAITSLIFIVAYAAILLPIILYSGALGLTGILNMRELTGLSSAEDVLWLTVWLIGIIGSIYAIFGGLRTVAVSDTLNGFGLLVGGVLIVWLGLQAVDSSGPLAALRELRQASPDKFNSLGGPESSVPFSTLFTGVLLLNLFYWCTNQQIIQRAFGATSLAEGQRGVLIAGWFKVLAPLILVLPGIMAFHLYGRVEVGGQMLPVQQVVFDPESITATADGETVVLRGAEARRVLQSNDVQLESLEDPEALAGATLEHAGRRLTVEAVQGSAAAIAVGPDGKSHRVTGIDPQAVVSASGKDRAYGVLVRHILPAPLAGFFAAVLLGAILSSFNSALNSTATLFSLGVYRDMLHPAASDEQVIRAGKWFGWIIAIAAMTVAPLLAGQESIFAYLQKMNGLYFIPIFSVVVVGMLTRRVPAAAANAALVLGFSVIALGYVLPTLAEWVDAVPALAGGLGFVPVLAEWLGLIGEFHFLGIVFALLVALMLLIGRLAPRQAPWEHRYSGDVDLTPWRFAWPVGLALAALVLTLYISLADLSAIW